MNKSFLVALLASTLLVSACQGGGSDSASSGTAPVTTPVTVPLNENVNFAAISQQIQDLENVVAVAQNSASISALIAPTAQDRTNASNIITAIDNLVTGWEEHKASMSPELLASKVTSPEWREAEAVVRLIKNDLRPAVNRVVEGGSYNTADFEFILNRETLERRIDQQESAIFQAAQPVVISASTSAITISSGGAVNSPERVESTTVEDTGHAYTGGSGITDLVRTVSYTRTTTQNMVYDRTWTIEVQDVTTTVYSDGSTTQVRGEIRSTTNTQTFPAQSLVISQNITQNIDYTVTVQNDPVVTVTNGEQVVVVENTDRIETSTQSDGSILNTTIRRSVTTTTTPVTTVTTYPNVSVYTYSDGHSFTWDAPDEVLSSIEEIVEVAVNETVIETTTEHVVATETTTNEVVIQVTEADPVFATTYEDETTTSISDGVETTTVTRYYTTTATVVTTTTTRTTPVTVRLWTDGTEETIRGETVVTTETSNTVQTDSWNVVMSTTTREVDVVNDDDPNMGTRTAGYNPDPTTYRTSEFSGSSGTNYKLAINADVAYSRGWTGKGSLITIADTGWDRDHTDLVGAVKHELNTMTNDTTFMDDNVGHGSHVLGIAAGRKNGSGTHGVAFDADVAVAKITDSTGYSFQRALVAAAWARDLGSVAMNVSANYNEDFAFRNSITESGTTGLKYSNHYYYGVNGYNGSVVEAPLWATALGSNQILVNSAGNLFKDYVSGSAQMAHATDANGDLILGGRMLIVGSYDTVNQRIASYSNKAGTVCATWDFTNNVCKDAARASDFYILAPGDNIQSAYKDGTNVNMSGTSMAAPVVTGAIGIIHQMWPHMMGANLVQLLLVTADKDLPGYAEHTHGQGLLDLDKATQPVGATGIPTTGRTSGAIANIETLSGGASVGSVSTDAFAALSNVAVLDSFERDFSIDLNNAQAVDTRPGSQAETLSYGGTYDGYWNLAAGGEKYFIHDDLITSFKFDEENQLKGDWGLRLAYVLVNNSSTQLVAGIGVVKETDKFLNNTQQGFMGVGETHITNYAGVNVNHKFDNNWFAFGNLQFGLTDVEKSKEFSLVTGYSDLVSNSWGIGAGYQFDNGWSVGANFSQPLSISSGKMNYKVPVGRTLEGDVLFNEGSADASTKHIEYDTGFFVKYNLNDMSVAGYAEHRANVAGLKNNNEVNVGVKVDIKF